MRLLSPLDRRFYAGRQCTHQNTPLPTNTKTTRLCCTWKPESYASTIGPICGIWIRYQIIFNQPSQREFGKPILYSWLLQLYNPNSLILLKMLSKAQRPMEHAWAWVFKMKSSLEREHVWPGNRGWGCLAADDKDWCVAKVSEVRDLGVLVTGSLTPYTQRDAAYNTARKALSLISLYLKRDIGKLEGL